MPKIKDKQCILLCVGSETHDHVQGQCVLEIDKCRDICLLTVSMRNYSQAE